MLIMELQQALIDGDTSQAITLLMDSEDIRSNINKTFYQSKYNLKVTCLYLACDLGNDDVVEILLGIPGINVNYEAERGADTPLHAAASGGHTSIVEKLIMVKVHCVTNTFGSTPIQRAAASGHHEVLAKLLEYDKSLIDAATLNKTPLHWACNHGYLSCVELLVKHGADTTLRNSNNKRPVDMAIAKKHTDIVQFLTQEDDTCFEETSNEEQQENTTEADVSTYDEHDGYFNLRSLADFGAHQVHFEEEQGKVNREHEDRIHGLEEYRETQKSTNDMLTDDIEDIKEEYLDLRSLLEEHEYQFTDICKTQQQQEALNTDVKEWIQALETSYNTHREETSQEVKALAKRVEDLEIKIKQYTQPQRSAANENAARLCGIARRYLPMLKENMLASDHLDYLYSKEALTLEDIQMVRSLPGDIAQTQEMLYRLLGKRDPSWIFAFLRSLNRHQGTKGLVEIFRK